MKPPIVAFSTDFGDLDGYVAQMKGVVLAGVPEAVLVDVSHRLPPQDVPRAAALLEDVVEAFPEGTLHLVVVDPGVGTDRSIVAVEAGGWRFVAPDNGVLSNVVERFGATRIVECTDPSWWRPDVSNTFHGRDVMAPLLAHWASGVDPARFGVVRERLRVELPSMAPNRTERDIRGRVLWADHFGNLITNVRVSDLPNDGAGCRVLLGDRAWPIATTYETVEEGELLCLVGSSGRLEVAVNRGSAADRLGWKAGAEMPIVVDWSSESTS